MLNCGFINEKPKLNKTERYAQSWMFYDLNFFCLIIKMQLKLNKLYKYFKVNIMLKVEFKHRKGKNMVDYKLNLWAFLEINCKFG